MPNRLGLNLFLNVCFFPEKNRFFFCFFFCNWLRRKMVLEATRRDRLTKAGSHFRMFAVYNPLETGLVRRKCRASAQETSYECRICHRSFAKQYNLMIHERVHDSSPTSNDENSNLFSCDILRQSLRQIRLNEEPQV